MRFLISLFVSSVLAAPPFAQTPQPSPSPQPTATPAPAVKARQIVPTGAVSYTSKSAGFAMWLPFQPVLTQHSQVVPSGRTLISHYFSVRSQPISYVILAVANPPEVVGLLSDPSFVTTILDGAQKGLVDSFQAGGLGPHLQKAEALQLDKFAGREVKLSLGGGAETIRVRFYATPKTVYSISAIGTKADVQAQAAQIQRVFDSFRILPQ